MFIVGHFLEKMAESAREGSCHRAGRSGARSLPKLGRVTSWHKQGTLTTCWYHCLPFYRLNKMLNIYWSNTWKWLNDNASAIGVLSGLIPLAWTIISYIHSKRQELKEKRFEAYHRLIKQLVEGDNPDLSVFIDRQIAIIFELANFKEYYPVTRRILIGLRKTWSEKTDTVSYSINRVIEEIDLTLKHIRTK
jgi:hypothetical protein